MAIDKGHRFGIDFDDVHRGSRREILQAPAQMRKIDSIHCRAHAHDRREKMNFLLRMLVFKSIHQV